MNAMIKMKREGGRSFLIVSGRWISYFKAAQMSHSEKQRSAPRAALLCFIKAEETRVENALCNQHYINDAAQRYYEDVTNTKADRLTPGALSYA